MKYEVFACLPFLRLETDRPIEMSAAAFFPATLSGNVVDAKYEKMLVSHLKKHSLNPEDVTCIAFNTKASEEEKMTLMVDAIYMLYFILTSKELYRKLEAPLLQPFSKLIPADENYLRAIHEVDFKPMKAVYGTANFKVEKREFDLSKGLSIALEGAYDKKSVHHQTMQSLVRSIRYFVDGFMHRFENISEEGFDIPPSVFDPEIIIFLMTAFETLFHIEGHSSASDLKQTLRPMLHLKFSRPVETLWSWVDGFYDLHQHIVHGGESPDDTFTRNENISLSYMHIGIKMFIYSVMYRMYESELIEPIAQAGGYPPVFDEILADDVLIFLWREEDILRKLSIIMMQMTEGNYKEEYEQDARHLAQLYNLYTEKFTGLESPHIRYIPINTKALKNYKKAITSLAGEAFQKDNKKLEMYTIFPKGFLENLKKER